MQTKEVELELTIEELQRFADYCYRHEIKFNDWIKQLANKALQEEKQQNEL